MSERDCGGIRELIPDFVGARLDAEELEHVERHVTGCGECRAELELARVILVSRPNPPEGLAERIVRTVAADRRSATRPWWGITAAAIAALALGIGISSERTTDASASVPGYATEVEEGEIWVSDDGLVAGAPLFEGLSDEALAQLLEDLALGASGGAA